MEPVFATYEFEPPSTALTDAIVGKRQLILSRVLEANGDRRLVFERRVDHARADHEHAARTQPCQHGLLGREREAARGEHRNG